jgi:hypothetical protein
VSSLEEELKTMQVRGTAHGWLHAGAKFLHSELGRAGAVQGRKNLQLCAAVLMHVVAAAPVLLQHEVDINTFTYKPVPRTDDDEE